jgi:hypothetical protein
VSGGRRANWGSVTPSRVIGIHSRMSHCVQHFVKGVAFFMLEMYNFIEDLSCFIAEYTMKTMK